MYSIKTPRWMAVLMRSKMMQSTTHTEIKRNAAVEMAEKYDHKWLYC
jgi:hypothetical protein